MDFEVSFHHLNVIIRNEDIPTTMNNFSLSFHVCNLSLTLYQDGLEKHCLVKKIEFILPYAFSVLIYMLK